MKNNIKKIEQIIKKQMIKYEGSHDWFHIERVLNNARYLHEKEGGDWVVIALAVLLHDIGDPKISGKLATQVSIPKKIMLRAGIDQIMMEKILDIVGSMSYSSGKKLNTIEGRIVQDADRLDAIGAIGIARAFAYGGKSGRALWDPKQKPVKKFKSRKHYHSYKSSSLNHFDEKLFKLKKLMNTKTGKLMASERDKFLHHFYKRFKREWLGKI